MRARHPALPTRWLMTDERLGERLWQVLEQLPAGSGVIFRHYALSTSERRALFARIARIARRRRLVLVRAGSDYLGRHEQGRHGREGVRRGMQAHSVRTWPAHNVAEVIAGRRAKADVILISPVFATRSHPGGRALGPIRAAALARLVPGRAIALGGMDADRFRRLRQSGFQGQTGFEGWAAIDGWQQDQAPRD